MLPPKLHPARPPPQPLPQQNLRQRHLPPQPPRDLDRGSGSRTPHNPSPTKSSLWRSHGEVAARSADGGAMALPLPPLHHPTGGPPPHDVVYPERLASQPKGRGEEIKNPNPPHPGPNPKSSLSRSDGEGDREWWRGETKDAPLGIRRANLQHAIGKAEIHVGLQGRRA
jgi:hypothetical protein